MYNQSREKHFAVANGWYISVTFKMFDMLKSLLTEIILKPPSLPRSFSPSYVTLALWRRILHFLYVKIRRGLIPVSFDVPRQKKESSVFSFSFSGSRRRFSRVAPRGLAAHRSRAYVTRAILVTLKRKIRDFGYRSINPPAVFIFISTVHSTIFKRENRGSVNRLPSSVVYTVEETNWRILGAEYFDIYAFSMT